MTRLFTDALVAPVAVSMVAALSAFGGRMVLAQDPPASTVAALSPYIDVHAHLEPHPAGASVAAARQAMKTENARTIIFLPPPETSGAVPFDSETILQALKDTPPQAFAFLGGGGTLNAMIQDAVRSGDSGPQVQRQFRQRAETIVRQGALGFGEMTAEHFAGATPYQHAPPDHPLYLLLSDLAARHGVVIDLHMEAVPQSMKLPADLKSPPNSAELHENIMAFERLLAHNRAARIVWAHAGADNTGFRTADLSRRLLGTHANLYLEIKLDPLSPGKTPLREAGEDGLIKPEWLRLIRDFPDRFVIGSDQHYPMPTKGPQRWQSAVRLLNQLPEDLRRKVASENALSLYRLR
jgi:predicted TIM-barrel fold metal-dependent hydrolase